MASSVALCTTETIQMGSPQQLESTWIVSVVYRATEEAMECFMQSQNFWTQLKSTVQWIAIGLKNHCIHSGPGFSQYYKSIVNPGSYAQNDAKLIT